MLHPLRLGVNIDHVATVRNARGGVHPDPLAVARLVADAGADGITVHLREDRRHIVDDDVKRLRSEISLPLNLEMAATDEMVNFACREMPDAVCLVPERREELTTEGGLDVVAAHDLLAPQVARLTSAGCRVSMFIDPERAQLEASRSVGAAVVELHTGAFCDAGEDCRAWELERLRSAAAAAVELGLECHAGHGISFDTVGRIAGIPTVVELNIGHFLIGEAIYTGVEKAVRRMRSLMTEARNAISTISRT
ncbi:MAG: pyridoxine 5'-phosphate synthase [Proteobacteria bacterium]|nr:pyridoxine 5'-phosphate synthase [Pseudomonadota bacterium]